MIGITIQPSPFLLRLNIAIHFVLFIGFCLVSPILWISVVVAIPFGYLYRQAERHLQLTQQSSIHGILCAESGWSIKPNPALNVAGTSKEGWLAIESPTDIYLSRYFVLLKMRDRQGRQFLQWLTPSMVGESEYRRLCRWLLTQQSEDKKPKAIPML